MEGCPDTNSSLSFIIFLNKINKPEKPSNSNSSHSSITNSKSNIIDEDFTETHIINKRNTAKFKENLDDYPIQTIPKLLPVSQRPNISLESSTTSFL